MNGQGPFRAVLNGVGDQVLEELHKMRAVTSHRGQRPPSENGRALGDGRFEVVPYLANELVEVDELSGITRLAANLSVRKQVGEQLAHLFGAVRDEVQILQTGAGEMALVALPKELRKAHDHAQGLLQVVAGGEGELL